MEGVRREIEEKRMPVEISESIFDPRAGDGENGKWKETQLGAGLAFEER